MENQRKIHVNFDHEMIHEDVIANCIMLATRFVNEGKYQVNRSNGGREIIFYDESSFDIFAGAIANFLAKDYVLVDQGRGLRSLTKIQR